VEAPTNLGSTLHFSDVHNSLRGLFHMIQVVTTLDLTTNNV